MSQDRPRYLSYLIRMRQIKGKHGWQWRASLESPGSGMLHSLPSLDHLITFIKEQTSNLRLDDQEESMDE